MSSARLLVPRKMPIPDLDPEHAIVASTGRPRAIRRPDGASPWRARPRDLHPLRDGARGGGALEPLDEVEPEIDARGDAGRGDEVPLVDDTLAGVKKLLPPATVEYIEKQPTLEDVFLAVVGGSARTHREAS